MKAFLKPPTEGETATAPAATVPEKDVANETSSPKEPSSPTHELAPKSEHKHEVARPAVAAAGVSGDFNQSDVRLPRLQIVQGSGELSKKYQVGTLLLMDEVLFDAVGPQAAAPVLRFVPVALKKQYREKKGQDEETAPRTVNTVDEVYRLGGTLEFEDNVPPTWSPSAQVLMFIEKPENVSHPGFSIEVEKKLYAPAIFYASNSAYRSMAVQIYSRLNSNLRDADNKPFLQKRFWSFRVLRTQSGAYTIFVPEVRLLTEDTSPALRAEMANYIDADVSTE